MKKSQESKAVVYDPLGTVLRLKCWISPHSSGLRYRGRTDGSPEDWSRYLIPKLRVVFFFFLHHSALPGDLTHIHIWEPQRLQRLSSALAPQPHSASTVTPRQPPTSASTVTKATAKWPCCSRRPEVKGQAVSPSTGWTGWEASMWMKKGSIDLSVYGIDKAK